MPTKPKPAVTSEQIASHMEQTKSMTAKDWYAEFGQTYGQRILKWLDDIEITFYAPGNPRFFLLPLDKAAAKIRSSEKKFYPKPRTGRVNQSKPQEVFVILFDPMGFFRPGSCLPALQVWGKEGQDPPTDDEFFIGTRMELLHSKTHVGIYEHTAEGFKEVMA